ncbi:hypothetical protein [Virgibacillus oceani]|uniref:Integrase catalytic domain-containing protein n=1 Tax=Virgibacillus oceani TaxID=1479511 RepID=A0A917HG75_9BACI|nr:hypothetical protein [Virgibacillus oceani]GGG77585.1 hypothetical protein GCM10011398_23380 [Virgibacillus oceani]
MSKYKNLFNEPDFPKELIDRSNWATVYENNLEGDKKEIFLKRKKAVDMYMDGEKTIKEICSITKVNHTDLYRLLKRCVVLDSNGQVFGYKALIPNFRIKPYTREVNIDGFGQNNEDIKLTGAFQKLLDKFPDIKEEIKELVFKKKKNEPSTNISMGKDLHRKFINICKKHPLIDYQKGDYPFNTDDFAKRSFYRYIKNLKLDNPNKTVKEYGKDSEVLLKNTGTGTQTNNIIRPFHRVEFDGHKIDTTIAIKYTTPEGDEIVDVMERIWLLTIVDCGTNCTLGYTIVLNKEYSAADVLTCVKTAVLPRSPIQITIPGINIPDYGGFPSDVIPETAYAVWDELLFDNAMANIAKNVKSKLKRIVGCQVNTGPVGTPTKRPLVEKLYHLLEENGFQKLTTTTGSHLRDPKRQNPEVKAIKYEVTPDEIEQLAEVLIARRNGTPQKRINGLSPLEVMQQRINRKMPYRKIDEEYKDGYEFLTIDDTRVIRGSLEKGRRPYIRFMGVDYRNDALSEGFDLIGTKLTLIVNIEDLRYIKAYLHNGAELGLLKAAGKWSVRKHSIKIRKVINKLVSTGQLKISLEEDPIDAYHIYLKEKAKNNKSARNQLAAIDKVLNRDREHVEKNYSQDDTDFNNNGNNIHNIHSKSSNKAKKIYKSSYKKRERFFFNS